jgi:regulator of RNase E activity RraA
MTVNIPTGTIHRPQKRLVDAFKLINTGTACNALDKKAINGTMFGIKPTRRGARVLGCAVTVLETTCERGGVLPEDMNLAAIVEAISPGDVVVVANNGNQVSSGGGVFAYALKARGAAGFVVDGGVRDIEQISEYQLPTFAKHVVPLTGKARIKIEAINQPILVDGILINPGDIILGDDTGVVRIPQEVADEIRLLAEKQDSLDSQTIEYMRQGLPFREAQARAGVK